MPEHQHDHNEGSNLSEMDLRVRALETILVDKGYIETAALDRIVELYETKIGPHIGAQVVAKAWTDPGFRQALLEDASKAVATLAHVGNVGEHLIAVENTPQVHNMIVCTLCSCYPRAVLGLPPSWYKSREYRARAVREPRAVLREFGTEIPDSVELRVHDSTADMRYLVLPMRPAGSESLGAEQLAALITRDSMVGVSVVQNPSS
jgi:nitrile hydratase